MSHKDVLKLLFPADLGGAFDADLDIEGAHLDTVQADADILHQEVYPDQTTLLLHAWERVCGLSPSAGEPVESRRAKVLKQLTRLGGLSVPYFVSIANDLGYGIVIEELSAFMSGWSAAADMTNAVRSMAGAFVAGSGLTSFQDVLFTWRVWVTVASLYRMSAGVGAAGDRLMYFTGSPEVEAALQDLKPAHTLLMFAYREN